MYFETIRNWEAKTSKQFNHVSVLLIIDRLNDLNVTYIWLASHFGGHLVDERDVVHLYGVPLGVDVSAPHSTPPSLNVRPHRGRGGQFLLALSKSSWSSGYKERTTFTSISDRQTVSKNSCWNAHDFFLLWSKLTFLAATWSMYYKTFFTSSNCLGNWNNYKI